MPVAPVSLPPTKRLTVFILASLLFLFHLTLASRLSSFSNSLRSVLGSPGDDQDLEGGEGGRLYGIITLVRIGRLWSLCSAAIALTGIYSIYKSNLALLRLFTLNSFLSLALDFLLLLLILILILASASSSSSSRSVATTLCQTLSTSNSPTSDELSWWGLPDLLGLSLEACEERFEGVVMSGLIVLGAVEGLRGAAAIQLLSYYTMVAKRRNGINSGGSIRRSGRGSGLRVETGGGGGGGGGRSGKEGDAGERYYDSPVQEVELATTSPSTSTSKGKGRERENSSSSKRGGEDTRIFLLPSRSRSDGDGKGKGKEVDQGNEVPLLSLTPSTPNRTTFPPQSIVSPRSERGSNSRSQTLPVGPKVLVYQPVMMTVEEARQYGASELLLHSSHPKRSRSHSSSASQHHRPSSHSHSHSHSSSDRRNRSSTITPSSSHAASPPKSSSSSSRGTTLLDLMETSTSPTPTEDSMMTDDLPTPKGEIGLAGLLRGDLEDEREHVKRA